ncbi:MAG: amidohydrolase family protein [Candidatus Dormibacteraceae bacterium]
MFEPSERMTGAGQTGRAIVDADVHCVVPRIQALFPYLAAHWREYISQSGFKGAPDTSYPPKMPTTARPGSVPLEGGPAGSSPRLLREQVLDPWNVERAILNCDYAVESIHNPDAEVAVASAVNDWIAAEWLSTEPRLRASIVVPSKQPDQAAREIDRLGGHPGFVQVFLPVRSAMPYGKRQYHAIYEAAARHGLVVGLHFGGAPGNPPTSSGWPSYYIEEYSGMAQEFQYQIMSMIVEGVFDRFPTLRVALVESGFSWLPPFCWRFDKEWKGLRREIPWTRRLPSEYIRDHVRVALQPIDGPTDSRRLLRLIDQLGSDDFLMFSTDYPHWHFNTPEEALPGGLPENLTNKIMAENARAFYHL